MAGQGAGLAAAAKASAQAATTLDPEYADGWALLGAATLISLLTLRESFLFAAPPPRQQRTTSSR